MGINGIGVTGYPTIGYTTKNTETVAEGFTEIVAE